MTQPAATPETTPRRGWRRGLVMAAIALVVALVLRDRERTRGGPRPSPAAAPLPTPSALPADASLGAPAAARPRLLALLPGAAAAAASDGLGTRLRQACAERIAFVEADEQVAKALGFETLPAFVLYGDTGRERKRFSGPDAVALLVAELQTLGVTVAGSAGGSTP
jgi:hypothetical protein